MKGMEMGKLRSGNVVDSKNLPLGGSPLNPVPLRTPVKTRIERGMGNAPETYDLDITILDIFRGREAQDQARVLSKVDAPMKPGLDCVLCHMKLGYYRRGRGFDGSPVSYEVKKEHFSVFSVDGLTEYSLPSVSLKPEHSMIGQVLSAGESLEGWIILEVPKNEEKPLLAFRREKIDGVYWVWGCVWLRLH